MRQARSEARSRDAALRRARLATIGGVAGALGLTGAFTTAAAITFSGKAGAAPSPSPPQVPKAAAPVQHAPPPPIVIPQVVHHRAAQSAGQIVVRTSGGGPAPPAQAPAAAPAPPPPPACTSTPSHPC